MGMPVYDQDYSNGLAVVKTSELLLHRGMRFTTCYSTPNLGAQTTPDDMIQLHYTTPPITEALGAIHMTYKIRAADGTLFKLTEAPTGGLADPEGILIQPGLNRVLADVNDPPVTTLYYNGTAATGGLVLVEEYIGQSVYTADDVVEEWILKGSTAYALSLYNTAAVTATIRLYGNVY